VFRRLWDRIKRLWRLAKDERGTPREIFWASFLGGFASATPAVGFHGWVAIGLATLFKKNRLFAWLGSRISNMVFLPFIIYAEVQIAHWLRTGSWVALDVHDRERIVAQAGGLFLDWCIGTVPIGIALGIACGALGWLFAKWRERRRKNDASRNKPDSCVPASPEEGVTEAERAAR
jgi:uncharacterized protein (DUF2062 family)